MAILKDYEKWIAVMLCGLNRCNPRSNYRLAEQILEKGGCMIIENLQFCGYNRKTQLITYIRVQYNCGGDLYN